MEIRLIKLILVISIIQFSLVVQGDEFVTLWAPKTIIQKFEYTAVVLPTRLQGNTEVALQFHKYNFTKKLVSGHAVRVEYHNKTSSIRKPVNLIMTLHVDEPIDNLNSVRICSTKSLVIKVDTKPYHTFIQTDKPIYKPGDEVKFKVLVVNRNIRPFHMNNIDVDIIDPLNRSIAHFDDLEDATNGIFEGRFTISSQTVLGDWTIQVIVDRSKKIMTLKRFAVQKYTFPLFDVFVNVSDQHVLVSSQVSVSFHAKYPFGEFVTGSAELKIVDAKNKSIFTQKSFRSINGIQMSSFKLQSDLGIVKDMELEAVVTFTESESGLSYNKSARFFVHTDTRQRIIAKHPEKFLPGQLFTVKVVINDWKGNRISRINEKVTIIFELLIDTNWNQTVMSLDVVDGSAGHDILVPKETTGLKIKVEFSNSEKYEKTVEMGNIKVAINDLEVYHVPRFPKINQTIDIYIKSDRNLDNVLAVAMTRYGPVKSGKIDCKNQTTCQFQVKINEKLMPTCTLVIYHLKDQVNVFLGKTEIETENVGGNYLNLKLSSEAPKPKQQIQMTFSTKSNSQIHLLAFDKRLKSLKEGNTITKHNVASTLADYDGEHYLLIDDMTSWHECTAEELKRVDTGKKANAEFKRNRLATAEIFSKKGSKDSYDEGDDDEDIDSPLVGAFPDDDSDDEKHFDFDKDDEIVEPEINDEDVRKEFPESWLFETIEFGNSEEAVKTFTVPDSMTCWDISAFSVNKEDGLAIMKPKELIVKNDFFIKINLPYSIRFKEVLKLDILIYNYIESYEQLDVTIDLKKKENFEIVGYSSNCTLNVEKSNTRTASVSPMEVKKVSFYIQAVSVDSTNFEAKMSIIKLLITAKGRTGNGVDYQDKLEEELRVDPIGLRLYDVSTNNFYLDKSSSISKNHYYSGPSEYARYSAIVSGNYLSNGVDLESMIEIFSGSTLEDKALKLKESYEAHRLLISKGQKPSRNFLNTQYQNIMSILSNKSVKPSIPFRAVFSDTVASLMKSHIISTNKPQILEHFDAIETEFIDNIRFNSTPWFQEKIESECFKVAFALIPLIKHKDLLSNSFTQLRFFYSGTLMIQVKIYNAAIDEGMNYLKNNENMYKDDTSVMSIVAYVHALNDESQFAHKLLLKMEKFKDESESSTKCFKLKSTDTYCDNLVTAYTALAYMKLNDTKEATAAFNWLLNSNPFNKFTLKHAVVTEAVAEIGRKLKNIPTDLKVKIDNNLGFQTAVSVKNDLAFTKVTNFPEYTRNISTTVTGSGYCSVSIVVEKRLTVPQINPKLNISIDTSESRSHISERTVKVCAVYKPSESDPYYIDNVFYEIEIPSGYVFNKYIQDREVNKNIMEVQERRKGTLLSIYINEFHQSKEYCVKIKATKVFTVKEISDAAVRVYDYAHKENNNIQFYSFNDQQC